ncbi:MAG: BREX-2 system adenine-specific DNA-methyltransferase PglX [Polyangiaceae bacterium]
MASRKKKSSAELVSQADPQATLDSARFLKEAQGVLALLIKDLLARADASPAVTRALKARHAAEKQGERTADSFAVWRRNFIDQVAAAWLLSCVFVRTLEDRGLLQHPRLAGPGAIDSQTLFFQLAPSLTERDYLLTVFRELSRLSAARDLFDARHNPVWLLAPSADAAKALLNLFRLPQVEAPAFRFGQADTRFLGDLYQDLSENVRKRYALLQTPRFVESFILDRTLEPAIERFGLGDTTLIDPTCGSGHFLLGAFERLFDHRLRGEPGLGVREAARLALDAVHGADINPYAVAIARFRLTLAYLEKAGFTQLADAPELPLHLVVADSLLHNPQLKGIATEGAQQSFGEVKGGQSRAIWQGQEFALEDEAAAREVLYKEYTAVVGNPPYITVKDKALRERYRKDYVSAAGKYSLAAPFAERFFQLGKPRAFVGMITANSFMKREFGKRLIEEYLPAVDLNLIINTSGAYIPGHGTPTVLLFGTHDEPQGSEVHSVLASRGEPSTPGDPEQGLVWRSIADHWSEVGFENDYITVAKVERSSLAQHPWSLGGGGATELKELLESRAEKRLGDLTTAIGFDAIMGEDDVFAGPPGWLRRLGATDSTVRGFGVGENVRDWSLDCPESVLFPYDEELVPRLPVESSLLRHHFWKYRTVLINRQQFGKNTLQAGLAWFEYRSFYKSKRSTPFSIAFAFVATHNHFVLDRGGKVFNRSAPIIKLPESATEDDHYALLAYLNSSTACFWMKQMFMNKGATSDRGVLQADEDKFRFEFDGTKLKALPLPPGLEASTLRELARECTNIATSISICAFTEPLSDESTSGKDIVSQWERASAEHDRRSRRLVGLQEEIDWHVYRLFGLTNDPDVCAASCDSAKLEMAADSRAFCSPDTTDRLVAARRSAIATSPQLSLVENAVFKRRWYRSQGKFNAEAVTDDTLQRQAFEAHVLTCAEGLLGSFETRTRSEIVNALAAELDRLEPVRAHFWAETPVVHRLATNLVADAAVPFLGAWVHTQTGIAKHAEWQHTWSLQRREDAGENVGEVPVPPKYAQKDYRDANYWRLRGKLDVPKERFISYPGCESDEDGEPVYGWAGWDHEQRARALGTLYQNRKTQESWEKDRLTPMLAGLLELLPWLHQWHADPNDDYAGQSPAQYFEAFLNAECQSLSLTHDDLRNWRPPEKKKAVNKRRFGRNVDPI